MKLNAKMIAMASVAVAMLCAVQTASAADGKGGG